MTADLTLFGPEDVPGTADPVTGICNPGIPLGTIGPETGMANPSGPPTCAPGHQDPCNGQCSPQVAGGQVYAFDWSIGRGVVAVDPRGFMMRPQTLRELITWVPAGSVLVGESTFESYDPSLREGIIRLAASRGVALLTVPARGNTWRRLAAGFPEKTSQSRQTDFEDARAIQQAALNGAHLKVPVAAVDAEWAELRDRAAKRFVYLRCSGQKDAYALDLMRRLPPFTLQPAERRVALGPVGAYNQVIVAAVGVAAEFVSDRPGFERLTGLYAHGYPSQFRSDLMHWGWGKRPEKRERISLSVYRRELRWLFHQFK
jgi:hypothetical protein